VWAEVRNPDLSNMKYPVLPVQLAIQLGNWWVSFWLGVHS
jgi:hypothetical protein